MSVSITAVGYLSYTKANGIIRDNVSQIALQTVTQTNKRLELMLDEYASRSDLIFGDKKIQKGMLGEFQDSYDQTSTMQQIWSFLSNMVNAKNDTLNIFILGEKHTSYRYRNTINPFAELPPASREQQEQDWYKAIKAADGKIVWYGIRPSLLPTSYAGQSTEEPVFCIGRAIKDLDGKGSIIGVLVMEFDPASIRQLLSEVDFHAGGSLMIVDSGNRVVADSDGSRIMAPSGIELPVSQSGTLYNELQGEKMITVFDESAVNDWKLVGMAPLKKLEGDSSQIGVYTLLLVAGFTLISIVLALVAARQMHRPVITLLRSMRKASDGDFDARITTARRDEFGALFSTFNVMVARIKQLIDELYIQKLIKTEMQLKMMGSQINAHFLYNTLDSIHWISRIYKVDEISTMIFGLSRYLRLSLNEGKEFVTVKECVDLLESYLSIQQIRYEDKFTVRMSTDPELLERRALKFVFQPLVENAIYHGLESKLDEGRLDINWHSRDGLLIFEVKDDGVGIPADKLAELHEMLGSEELQVERNFALKNINSQIKLTYGKEYGLYIESEVGAGTTVRLTIPLR
nr:sensor histidine kinase [Paenibacillus sacheonensis]